MKQQSLASQAAFEKYGRKSRRELFLDDMERIVPWAELSALAEPHYAKAGNGRRPVGLAIMLRTYFLQQWFNLSDPAWRRLCTSRLRWGASWAWTWASLRRRTRPPSAASAICWRNSPWARRSWRR